MKIRVLPSSPASPPRSFAAVFGARSRLRVASPGVGLALGAGLGLGALACGSESEGPPTYVPPPGYTIPDENSGPLDASEPGAPAPGTPSPGREGPSEASPLGNPVPAGGDWTPPATIDPSTPVGQHGQLRVEGNQMVDESGAPVQLEGISSMWLNWENRYSQSKAGLQWARDNWDVTLYRVAVGVEPPGAYLSNRAEMMRRMRIAVRNAIELGLYVIIDWHDHHAHENQEEAIAFFSQVAAEFGAFPHVLYETFNEPELDVGWSSVIKPYHEAVIPAIRAQDPDNIIILGNRQWDQRPDEAADDPVVGDNLMYTVHFYACEHRGQQRADAQEAFDRGLPLFVTEWGATPADGGANDPIVCADEAQAWHDFMTERSISWAAWKFDGCNDSSCFFNSDQAPVDGPWTAEWLNGHAAFVRDRLLD